MNEIINKFREQMQKNKGNSYPIEEHTLLQKNVDEYTKETYLKMLCVIMRYEGQGSEEQALFIKRLIKGIGGENSFEEYLRKAMEVDVKFFDEVLRQIEENDLKYIFIIDALLVTYISPAVNDEQIDFVAELSEMVGLQKNEMKFISRIVKTVLEKDNMGYLKICNEIETVEEKEKLLIPFYPYVKEFAGGVKKVNEEVVFNTELTEEEEVNVHVEIMRHRFENLSALYRAVKSGDVQGYVADIIENKATLKQFCYIDFPKIRDVIEFGKYKWRVLDVDRDKVFLISDWVVSNRPFDSDYKIKAYKDSEIRRWLNTDFINNYFDSSEQKRITTTNLEDSSTKDKVFLLSINEAKRYFTSDNDREIKDGIWCLRNLIEDYCGNKRAACVSNGRIYTDYYKGAEELRHSNYIRPGMWVSL